jgi:hypothetical protein
MLSPSFMIKDKIINIRGKQIILDRDLARLYEVETKVLNQAVKRNKDRFPEDFIFRLTKEEKEEVVTNCDHLRELRFSPNLPFGFTEHGITALSGILKSKKAVEINIKIVRAFVEMRKFLSKNASFFQKFQQIDQKLLEHDGNFAKIFKALENDTIPEKGIFYDGQIFDAHKFVSDLINSAKNEIILIDNYIDASVLSLFSDCKTDVKIITKEINDKLKFNMKKYNTQYRPIKIETSNKFHDRFLIIDNQTYHFGASLKDLGKKIFAFSRFQKDILRLERIMK